MEDSKCISIFDSNHLFCRAYYKLNLQDSKGRNTGGIYGVLSILTSYINKFPEHGIIMCWDKGISAARKKLYSEYKAGRAPVTDEQKLIREDMHTQREVTKKFIECLAVPQIQLNGFEGDEMIYVSWMILKAMGYKIVVVTSDTDMLQLVDSTTDWYDPIKDKMIKYDNFKKEIGVDGDRYIEYKSLTGDASDGIEGIRGIGHVGATKLINKTKRSLLEIKNINTKDKLELKLLNGIEILKRNIKLIDLSTYVDDAAIVYVCDRLTELATINRDMLHNLFDEYDFRVYAAKLHDMIYTYTKLLSINRSVSKRLSEMTKDSSDAIAQSPGTGR